MKTFSTIKTGYNCHTRKECDIMAFVYDANGTMIDAINPGTGNHRTALDWAEWRAESIRQDYPAAVRMEIHNGNTEIAIITLNDTTTDNTPATMNANGTTAICPLDFDTVFDAYNYAMAHRHDENPLAVAIPTDAHGTDYGRSLALNGVKLFAVWSDELEETADGYVYTTEAGAREAMAHVEANDKEAGVYEPDYYKVLDLSKYFA